MKPWTRKGFERLCAFLEAERARRKLRLAGPMEKKAADLLKRLWEKTRLNGDCIESLRAGNYYPEINVFRGMNIKAHRLSFLVYKGALFNNICHSCDNPRCFNPAHLWRGTQAENVLDCILKGRRSVVPFGEKHPGAIVCEEDIRKIIPLYESGLGAAAISKKLGLPWSAVRAILRGRTWKHLPYKFTGEKGKGCAEKNLKLKCLRCLHVWIPNVERPKRCSKCRSWCWDSPRKKQSSISNMEGSHA